MWLCWNQKSINVYINSPCVTRSLPCHRGFILACRMGLLYIKSNRCLRILWVTSANICYPCENLQRGFPIGVNLLNHSFVVGRSCKNTQPQWTWRIFCKKMESMGTGILISLGSFFIRIKPSLSKISGSSVRCHALHYSVHDVHFHVELCRVTVASWPLLT
jgi:hypothetical protein